jgi:sodium-coupled neutral amino acid transporter 11
VWIIVLSAIVLLPLSLMRDLSSLAIGSVIGTAGTLYTALFIWLRKFDGSYAVGGKFHELIAESARPAFAAPTLARPLINPSIFVLVSMLATAFLAHYNAPKYYKELATPTDGSSKQVAFNKVCAGAFGAASLLCLAIMAGGFLTFGGASQGLILNSYATADPLALLARLGICASIIFSYPLNFVGLRDGVLNMIGLSGSSGKASVHITSTLVLLCIMNGLALKLKNLGLVVAVGGAALGTSLVYTFPALMFIQATRQLSKRLEAKGEALPASRRYEMFANMLLVLVGVSLGGLGVTMSLKSVGGH